MKRIYYNAFMNDGEIIAECCKTKGEALKEIQREWDYCMQELDGDRSSIDWWTWSIEKILETDEEICVLDEIAVRITPKGIAVIQP